MTERLPSVTSKDLFRALGRAGFSVSRTTGSHCRLIHATDPARKVTVPIHSGDLSEARCVQLLAKLV
ncbi:MAG TPA: type II toxin-antitoxin system HicA family toxin [Xanthobacteraceae bacterium]|nr:type II toxin-antitoxin system HicA family toxin [Xanthobacteraceae bacterium]